jgi:DNA mismatch repair protein MutS
MLLTGPNMAGKTTYGRMVLQVALMAQCGSFVPAERARLGLVDRIFLRSGAADDIAGGRSTFMVEMTETAAILRSVTLRSLAFFDEIGRGTSTFDGMAIARAVVECLAGPDRGCRTIFSTHYHELAAIEEDFPAVRNFRMDVREAADQVCFTYHVVPGSADRSYGVHVARLAGLPAMVIARASEVLASLEVGGAGNPRSDCAPDNSTSPHAGEGRGGGLRPKVAGAVPPHAPVVHALVTLDPERMTPLDALNTLAELQAEARRWVAEND